MQRSAFHLQLNFHNFLGIVPGAAGVRHEDGLVETEDRNGNQVADKEKRLNKGKSQRGEEHSQEDIEHALLRVLGADLHDFLAVFNRRFLHALKLDVLFDELHRAVSSGGYRLHGSAGKPINDGAAGDQAKNKWRMQQ